MLKNILHITFLVFCINVYTQEPIRYTTKEGLPTNHVYDMQEDADGFMWFATKQGLVKFDGETFKTATIKDGLHNNDTWKLDLDNQGRLWYFSKSAYQGYIIKDHIYKFSTKEKTVLTPRFFSKSKDNYWFYSDGFKTIQNNEIVNVELNANSLDIFQKEISETYFNNEKDKISLFCNPENKEIVQIESGKKVLIIYDWNFNKKRSIKLSKPINLNSTNNFIENGLMYNQIGFSAFKKGVLFIDFKENKTKFIEFKELFGVEKVIYFRCKVLNNEFQISIPGHLAIFDYQLSVKEKFSFSNQLGQHSYKDSRGHIWLTDISKGVSLIPNTKLKTTSYFENLKVQKINAEAENLYVGINNKGIYSLNTITNNSNQLINFKVPHSEIYHIKKDRDANQMRIITATNSYNIVNQNLVRTEINNTINSELDYYSKSGAKDIISFNNETYLIANGVFKSNPKEKFSKRIASNAGLNVVETFNNQLFFGASDGLFQLQNDSLIKIQPNTNLLDVSILTLLSEKENLLVGTNGRGVYLYNKNRISHLKNTDGFSVQEIIQKENSLWLATNKGVHQVELNNDDLESSKIINSFYEADGLLQNNINDIYIKNDTLYTATDIGISKINTKDILYQQKPKIYFKSKRDTLSFKNEARDNIAITFGLHNYVNQEYVKYEYRLLPSQKKWTTTQTKNLNFSNLSPNLHELQVKAVDQHFNETIVSQYINIVPKWWQTTTSKISFGLLGLLCFLGFIKLTKNKIQKKEEAKSQIDKKIAGLELQALRSQMNPHFVHNSLNAIQYFIQRNEVELSEDYLVKFSKLVRTFFEYSRRQNISIRDEANLLENYLQIEKLRFEEKLNFEIKIDAQIDAEEQVIPSMILQPIIENSVNHGLFHKPEKGTICVHFKYIDKITFEVIVTDDGIGINKAKEIFKNSTKNYQSHSTSVLKERLELLQQSREWMINYTIIDLNEKDKTKEGTEVKIVFKNSTL